MKELAHILLATAPFISAEESITQSALKIEQSYNPAIEVQTSWSGWSLYGCTTEDVSIWGRDPVTKKQRQVSVRVYKGSSDNKKAVIILPPTGGENILDRGYANELCWQGATVALVTGWDKKDETSLDFSMHNNGALRVLAATRHVVEYLKNSGFDSIGLLGTSIGAIATSLVLEFEPRITSAVLIVGSFRFADVIATSDEAGAKELRFKRMQALGYKNNDEYLMALKKNIWVEPAHFINRIGSVKTLLITADADTTVLTQYQLEALAHLPASEHIHLDGNHLSVIKDVFCFYRKSVVDFLSRF